MAPTAVSWVLGHQIRRWETDESYGLVEVTSLPKVPGPPPHFHKSEREFFLILEGTLDVMVNGQWKSMSAGAFVELPPQTSHTFVNNTDRKVVWVTGWRPKGFEKFFGDFGVPAELPGAQEQSVSEKVIERVVRSCEQYGMYLAR